jgi:hypothetical protein
VSERNGRSAKQTLAAGWCARKLLEIDPSSVKEASVYLCCILVARGATNSMGAVMLLCERQLKTLDGSHHISVTARCSTLLMSVDG